ncbi:hypothetical protein F5Y12DRAFT_713253 [Xylaria sp. FL1777]|nr:hypothetical protein F5Y12DRAFT_713253 [Xylaria sp. FL1777]
MSKTSTRTTPACVFRVFLRECAYAYAFYQEGFGTIREPSLGKRNRVDIFSWEPDPTHLASSPRRHVSPAMSTQGLAFNMSSLPPPKPYSLQFAERIRNTTGKEHLPLICAGGLSLESLWLTVIERKVLKTPAPAVRTAMFRAVATWPLIYVVTSAGISWAAWKVNQAERSQSEKD